MTEIRPAEGSEGEARDRILALLDLHSKAIGKSFKSETVLFEAHEDGRYLGGLAARFSLDLKWVFVELLAVAEESRGKGVGGQLMARVEQEARLRRMDGIWLDTFSFQAPEFYKRLGYSEFGRIDGYPENEARLFFVKRL
ncbi:Acetyltransferase [Roseovarius sp. EC-HK134]|uniref:Acetyltransferase n=1 Tax=Roseovarius mucosus TaxID=215743 RepID=A0A1V0RSZ9_9RHOB|nr:MULTISPECIES: GNAT family N-acetyltransferase [Roseovarius]ARE84775.1 acetyltransferase [Roseovarius mucosus]VVT21393.1 Acetyltransferase [Roseovarius sp. EC-SD190]VVT21497.1 Acetyltransferase [Roseovarius sp. EC-HK134]|tara:strand:- start:356 stop:775 length:420 start_codon:yes stop_codon:yes gene_type:complete